MEDYERVKQLRKHLKMSQTAFAESLGLTRSVIKNIELGTVEIKEHVIKLITTTFNVNEEWLRNGHGEMFIKSKQTILDELTVTHGLNNKEANIIKAFLDLSPEGRAGVLEYADKLVQLSRDMPIETTPTREEQIIQRFGDIDKLIKSDLRVRK